MADEGVNSAGSVSVDVVPNGKQFGSRLKALVVAAGNAASRDLADSLTSKLADSIVESVVEGIRDGGRAAVPEAAKAGAEAGTAYGDAFRGAAGKGTGDLPLPGPGPASRKGAESGGAFADAFKDRVEAALRSLPPIEIGAAATEADQKIRDIKTELATLSGQRIGIDITDTEALAKVSALKADLVELAAHSPSIRVNVDAAAAVAELEAIRGEVDTLGSSGLSSAGGLGALATTLVTLGPIAIPSAAAAAAAVAGIGAAGFGAAAGVGVVALALSRVLGAVKDMGAVQKETNTAVGGGTSNAFAYASALDGLKSAQAAYTNTVANAADAERQAAEQVVSAEQSVVDAQRSALQAQVALTEAKKQAQQQEEDLANSIVDGNIAQQQALLDQTTAHAKLAQLQANNVAAGNPQLVQAQIDAESADQRVKELALSQQRLADQQQQATTVGIAGAAGVVSAQQGVVTANEQVAKTEQSLSDARIAQATQARQAAFSIAQAQQGIVSAQRALQQSTQGVGGASAQTSAAASKLAQDMAALTPEGRAFATFIFGLKGGLADLQGEAEKGILPGAETLLKDLIGTYGPGAKSTVAGIATEVGKLEVSAGHTFTNPFWKGFFSFLEGEAVPTLDEAYRVSINFATGLAGIVRAGAPLAHDFGGGLLSFSEKFANSSKDLQDNPTFQNFLAYAEKEGPEVAHTLGEVAAAVLHVTQALAPIGDVDVRVIGELAEVIDEIPLPVLTALATVFIAVNLGLKTYNAYVAIATGLEKGWALSQKVVGDLLALLPGRATAAATATEALAVGETAAADAAVAAETSLGLVTDLLGGPLGIALGLAAAAFVAFSGHTEDNTAEVGHLTSSLGQLADAFAHVATNGNASITALVAQSQDLQELVINANKLGIAVNTIQSALAGNPAAAQQINAAYQQRIDLVQKALDLEKNVGNGGALVPQANAAELAAGLPARTINEDILGHGTDKTQATLNDLKAQQAAYQKQTSVLQQAAQAQQILNSAQDAAIGITETSTPAEKALGNAVEVFGNSASTASDKVSALKTASDALYGATRAAADANEAYFASIDQVNGALAQNGRSLDLAKASGRANTDAIKAQLDASNQLYFAQIAEGVSADDATKAHDARTKALVAETEKGNLNQKAVQQLIDTYGQVPSKVTTEVSINGAASILKQLEEMQIAQLALSSGISVDSATKEYLNSRKQATQLAGGLATGGPVDGLIRGPGTKTSDSVLLWGSAGEWMQPAHAVDYYGVAAMQAIQTHSIPKDALRMSTGGYVPPGVASGYRQFAPAAPAYASGGQVRAVAPTTGSAPTVQIDNFYAGDAGAQEIAVELEWQLRSAGG